MTMAFKCLPRERERIRYEVKFNVRPLTKKSSLHLAFSVRSSLGLYSTILSAIKSWCLEGCPFKKSDLIIISTTADGKGTCNTPENRYKEKRNELPKNIFFLFSVSGSPNRKEFGFDCLFFLSFFFFSFQGIASVKRRWILQKVSEKINLPCLINTLINLDY